MQVNLAYYRETHIDQASGHDQVIPGLLDRASVRTLDPCLPRSAPDWLVRRLAPPLGQHRRISYYEPSALPLEYAAMRKLVTAPEEVVHLFQGDPYFNYTAWARLWPRRGALVATFHHPPETFEEVWRFKHKRARLDVIDGLTVLSTPQLEYFRALVGDRVTLVPFGVNRRVFHPPAERPVRDEVRCISVGSWQRDPALLRRTIEHVCAQTDKVLFTVLAPGEYLAALGGLPRTTLGSGLHGAQLVDAYHAADLFVHPAARSTASTAMLEAMASGLPIVVPDVGGVRDYADDDCAEIVAPGDHEAMAEAILRLAADSARRLRLGARSDERTRSLDWAYIAHEYVQVYRRALERRARTRRAPRHSSPRASTSMTPEPAGTEAPAVAINGNPAYDAAFFDAHRSGSDRSAAVILPLVLDLVGPRSIIDVGCGTGEWLAVAGRLGVKDLLGIDGDWVPRDALVIPPERFTPYDLNARLTVDRRFDLAVCLEVAEHLDPARADEFVADLCALADVLLFSAAIPGQGGTDHRNEQWPSYWRARFAAHRFSPVDCLRAPLWDDSRVDPWYAQNVVIFVHEARLAVHDRLRALAARSPQLPLATVHPGILEILSPPLGPDDPEPREASNAPERLSG